MSDKSEKALKVSAALDSMAVGHCGVKWGIVVWRAGENAYIVGENGVRADGYRHTKASATEQIVWMLSR